MSGDADLFEIIETTRAMRRLLPDPVPDELIRKILRAGVCAPNGGNTQRWRFMVIKDEKIKRAVQVYYKRAFEEVVGPSPVHFSGRGGGVEFEPHRLARSSFADTPSRCQTIDQEHAVASGRLRILPLHGGRFDAGVVHFDAQPTGVHRHSHGDR